MSEDNRFSHDPKLQRVINSANQNRQRVGEIHGASDLSRVEWPTVEYYGYDHAKQVSQLAVHIGSWLGLPQKDLDIIKSAGLFHDIARRTSFGEPAPGHNKASAELADRYMRADPQGWSDASMREAVCRLIAAHTLDGPPPTDPRLIALWDAEQYDGARFKVGSMEGLKIMAGRFSKVITGWAKLDEHQTRWRKTRGWK